jgi:hypothetical protein
MPVLESRTENHASRKSRLAVGALPFVSPNFCGYMVLQLGIRGWAKLECGSRAANNL